MGLLDIANQQQDQPTGLLGQGFNDPRSAGILALAGNMVNGRFGNGLIDANAAIQNQQSTNLDRMTKAQALQIQNINMQRSMWEWEQMKKAIAEDAAQGNGAPASPSQPAIAPTPGGALGSGTFGIPLSGQPAVAASPAPTGGSAPTGPSSANPFGISNLVRGNIVSMFGGQPAATAFWDRAKLPDAVKTNNYYGLDPAAVADAMARENAAKGVTPARNGSTLGRVNADGTYTPFFSAPDTKDNAYITWDKNGNPAAQQIPGLTAGVQAVAKAKTAGEGEALPFSGVDARGNPLPVTNRTAAATQGQPPVAAPITNPGNLRPNGASTGFQNFATPQDGLAALDANLQNYGKQGVNTIGAIISKWAPPTENDTGAYVADVSKRLGVSPTQPLDMNNPIVRQALSTAITLHEQGPARVFGSVATSPASPASAPAALPASGQIYASPPLGAQQGATLSQDELSKKAAGLMADNSNANTVINRLQNLKMLAPGAIMGAEADRRDFYNGLLSLGGFPAANDALSASTLFNKNASQIALAMRAGAGAGGTDALQTLAEAANPNRHMTPEAAIEAANQLIAQQKMLQTKAQLLQPHYLARDPVAYGKNEMAFDQNADPRLWQIQAMPQQQQAAYIDSLPADVRTDLANKVQALPAGAIQNPAALSKQLSSGNASAPAPAPTLLPQLPIANQGNNGKFAIDHDTGKRYRSNGLQWLELK